MDLQGILELGGIVAGIISAWAVMRSQLRDVRGSVREMKREMEKHAAEDSRAHAKIDRLEVNLVPRDDVARKDQIESLKARVYDLSQSATGVNLMHARVTEVEEQVEKNRKDSGDLRVQLQDVIATMRESTRRFEGHFDDLGERIDRNEVAAAARLAEWRTSLESLVTRLVRGRDVR